MTERREGRSSDKSSQKKLDEVLTWGFRILICRDPHDALPQEAQLRSCTEALRVGLCLTARNGSRGKAC